MPTSKGVLNFESSAYTKILLIKYLVTFIQLNFLNSLKVRSFCNKRVKFPFLSVLYGLLKENNGDILKVNI
jgi:hypothetical protein